MKLFSRALLAVLSTACLATFAAAQTIPPGTFKHIIIVIQENRTPDNLFGYWATQGGLNNCPLSSQQFAGADLANGGNTLNGSKNVPICNVQQPMNNGSSFDPGHFYSAWKTDYDSGSMDGFCVGMTFTACQQAPSPYSYIQPTDVLPYYSIATTYGFANYMFQTNEGPSLPAHQFLFSGTSAPVAPNDPQGYYWDFVQDNPPHGDEFDLSGCPYDTNTGDPPPPWIEPNRTTIPYQNVPIPYQCYTHDSLMTGSNCTNGVCDKYPNLTWTYYSPKPYGIIWNAPEAIPEVCYGENNTSHAGQSIPCGSENGGAEWNNHMSFYSSRSNAPIFTDISSCKLANISWVIPDVAWSDHPSFDRTNPAMGPSWVADIVNAIGNSYQGGKCDYWGTHTGPNLSVEPTAIFIVWDDWGGFYDHIAPTRYLTGSPNGQSWNCLPPATNNWGCGYTYGFRVPFMVVSEFTGTKSGSQYSGYISGACGTAVTPPCPNLQNPYIHDFGSILAFTEQNFNLQHIDLINNGYADYNALDWDSGHHTTPLSDFFSLYPGGRPFVFISATQSASFFQNYYATTGATPTGPDTD